LTNTDRDPHKAVKQDPLPHLLPMVTGQDPPPHLLPMVTGQDPPHRHQCEGGSVNAATDGFLVITSLSTSSSSMKSPFDRISCLPAVLLFLDLRNMKAGRLRHRQNPRIQLGSDVLVGSVATPPSPCPHPRWPLPRRRRWTSLPLRQPWSPLHRLRPDRRLAHRWRSRRSNTRSRSRECTMILSLGERHGLVAMHFQDVASPRPQYGIEDHT
jgi:hypothetical protein